MKKIGVLVMSTISRTEKLLISDLISDTVQMSCMFSESESYTSEELSQERLFELIEERNMIPLSSQPAPYIVKAAIEKSLEKFESLIILTPHRTVSGTYLNVLSVVNEFNNENLAVIETTSVSISEIGCAELAIDLINEGTLSFKEIVAQIIDFDEKTTSYAFPNDPHFLKLSGRVAGTKALILSALHLKIVIKMVDAAPAIFSKVRGDKGILKVIKSEVLKDGAEYAYYSSMGESAKLRAEIQKLFDEKGVKLIITEKADMLPCIHFGPNSFGISVKYKVAERTV